MSDEGPKSAVVLPAVQYTQSCTSFHSEPIQSVLQSLEDGDSEIDCCPRADQVAPLVATLASLPEPMAGLTLRDAPEVAYAAEAVATAFIYIECIKLISCSLGGAGISALSRGLKNLEPSAAPACSVLDLSQNGLSAADMQTLVGPLKSAIPGLQALNLELNPLGSDGLRAVLPLVAPAAALRQHHPPSSAGAAPHLEETCALRVLSLRGCGIQDGGLSALASSLVQSGSASGQSGTGTCSSLRVLDISDNPASASGIVALCAALTTQLSSGLATRAVEPHDPPPGVVELLLADVRCSAEALHALAGLLLATAEVHKQHRLNSSVAAGAVPPGLQYLDLTSVTAWPQGSSAPATTTGASATSGAAEQRHYASAVLALLHACQTLVASSSGCVQLDGLAQLQDAAERLQSPSAPPPPGVAMHAAAPQVPAGTGKNTTTPVQHLRAAGDKWGAILHRLQGAAQSLASLQGSGVADEGMAPLAAALHEARPGTRTQDAAPQVAVAAAGSSAESSAEDEAGVPHSIAAFVRAQVQSMATRIRADLDSDIGTLLTEVAATSARVERLEEVVRAEQAASMQLLESLMGMAQEDDAQAEQQGMT